MRTYLAPGLLLLLSSTAAVAAEPRSAEELLAAARRASGALEYAAVIPAAEAALEQPALTAEQRVEALVLLASALAIVRDPASAQRPFRLLLRFRPDYELPKETPPKILAAFRSVQVEEKAIAAELEAQRRASLIEGLELLGAAPTSGEGGRPLPFSFRLRDPQGVVERFSVPYRHAGEGAYSVLALRRGEDGVWSGSIGAEQTASPTGFTLEYYLETADRAAPLLVKGSAEAPLEAVIAPGRVRTGPRVPKAAFWSAAGATAGFAVAWGVFGQSARGAQAEYDALVVSASTREVDGRLLNQKRDAGETYATAANVSLAAAAVCLVGAAVMLPMVEW